MKDYLKIKKAIELLKYCPVCKSELNEREVLDILVYGLQCKKSHRYYIPLEEVLTKETEGKSLILYYNSDNKNEITKAWLTNRKYRMHLNFQIAEVLRLFLELELDIYNKTLQNEREFKYCPICNEKLVTFKQDNIWEVGLNCRNNHIFYERENKLNFTLNTNMHLNLYMDMDYVSLISCTKSIITNKNFRKYLPYQIKELLLYFQDKLLKDFT